jgi:hypothetical protein
MGAAQLTEEVLFFEPSIHGKGHTRTPGPQGVGAGIFSNKWGANLTQSSSSPLMPEGRVWEASGGKGPSIYLGEIRPLSEKICFVIFSEMRQERAGPYLPSVTQQAEWPGGLIREKVHTCPPLY